jgi:hypothetical protein
MSYAKKKSCLSSPTTFGFVRTVTNGVPRRFSFSISRLAFSDEPLTAFSTDSVQCDRCKGFYHMHCVSPPLLAKPSRGYGWTCGSCFRQHDVALSARAQPRSSTPNSSTKPRLSKSSAPSARGRGRPRKDRTQAEREENLEVKTFKMWPFRYFGYVCHN